MYLNVGEGTGQMGPGPGPGPDQGDDHNSQRGKVRVDTIINITSSSL